MNEPILDQPVDPQAQSVKSLKVVSLWSLLLLTVGNFSTFYIPWMLLRPDLWGSVGENVRSAGESIVLLRFMVLSFGLLLMTLIGNWWGRSLAKNLLLPLWKIGLCAFAVSLFSNSFYNLVILLERSYTDYAQQYAYKIQLKRFLLSAGSLAFLFSGIVSTMVHFYRRGRFQFVYFAAVFLILLSAYLFYFHNW